MACYALIGWEATESLAGLGQEGIEEDTHDASGAESENQTTAWSRSPFSFRQSYSADVCNYFVSTGSTECYYSIVFESRAVFLVGV